MSRARPPAHLDEESPATLSRGDIASNTGDVLGRESAASRNDVMNAVKKLRAIGGMDILSEMMGISATQIAQDTYSDPMNPAAYLTEQRRSAEKPRQQRAADWTVQVVIKETAGKERTRYRVRNSKSNRTFQAEFRHERVAELAAACLNESGNVSDPRVKRVVDLSNQETALLKEINAGKRLYKSLPAGNVKRREVTQNQIEFNRVKLENVRLKLGV